MQVKEILRVKGSRLLSIDPAGRAAEAVTTMAKENLGSLVVMEQGRMVGMLTFHELLRALAGRNGSLGDLKVSDIMERDPVTAAPDMEVNDLRRTMLESGRALPAGDAERQAARRDLVPRRGEGGARGAGFREQDAQGLHQELACVESFLLASLGVAARRRACRLAFLAGAGVVESLPRAPAAPPRRSRSGARRVGGHRSFAASGTATPISSAPATPGSGIVVNPATDSLLNPGQYARRLFFLNAGCAHEAQGSVDRAYVRAPAQPARRHEWRARARCQAAALRVRARARRAWRRRLGAQHLLRARRLRARRRAGASGVLRVGRVDPSLPPRRARGAGLGEEGGRARREVAALGDGHRSGIAALRPRSTSSWPGTGCR